MKPEAISAEYLSWLVAEGYEVAHAMPGGLWCGIRRLIFHYTMHIGEVGDREGYIDRYCFADRTRAAIAIEEWRERGFEGEPKFWRKHPDTDRCRNDAGDPVSETIGWPIPS